MRFSIYRYEDDQDTIYLADVFVGPDIRGKGRGNEILKTADGIAKIMGAKSICLKVKKDSIARGWYERHGYKKIEDARQFVWMKKEI